MSRAQDSSHLKFSSRYTLVGSSAVTVIMNNIWNLPKLTHLELDMRKSSEWKTFCIPTIISTSLQSISISQHTFDCSELNQLVHHTPHLTCLNASIRSYEYWYLSSYSPSMLLVLNIEFPSDIHH